MKHAVKKAAEPVVSQEEQEYKNKAAFKEILIESDASTAVDKQADIQVPPGKDSDSEQSIEESDSNDEEDDEILMTKDKKIGTICLAGMTKEEKKAHKARVKEEKREKRKTKMSKYEKKKAMAKGKHKV